MGIDGQGTNDNIVSGNLIGTDAAGSAAAGNHGGIVINSGARNRIGGTNPGERNIISGSVSEGILLGQEASKNIVIGNFIGTDSNGVRPIPNGIQGVFVWDGAFENRIGGTGPGEGNVVSGNVGPEITLMGATTTQNLVLGNYVGTNADGTASLGGPDHGMDIVGGAFNNVVQANLLSGNGHSGILLGDWGSSYNAILGNRIGTDASGTRAIPNRDCGVSVAHWGARFNRIGGTGPEERNLVSGNTGGGLCVYSGGNLIRGNFIGTDITGRKPLGNGGVGVSLGGGQSILGGATPQEANVIAANGHNGVGANSDYISVAGNYIGTDSTTSIAMGNLVFGIGGVGHVLIQANVIAHTVKNATGGGGDGIHFAPTDPPTIRRNLIYDSALKGISGPADPSAPIIKDVTLTAVTGMACAGCEVEIFSDSQDEGRVFEGSVVAGASGSFTLTLQRSLIGPNVTATATDL